MAHKRKLIAQIRKGLAGKIAIETGELETLIFTRPKVGVYAEYRKGERADPAIVVAHRLTLQTATHQKITGYVGKCQEGLLF